MAKVPMIAKLRIAENGEYISEGDMFMADEDRVNSLVESGNAALYEGAGASVEEEDHDDEVENGEQTQVVWSMKNMTPEKYLEKYPNGPQANIAKAVLAQAADDDDEDDD